MVIVDHRGNPIERQALTAPQTARLAQLHQEFAEHPSRGLTPPTLAAILEDAERGNIIRQHELFADMEEKDGHILAELAKRKRALIGFSWAVCAPPAASAAEKRAAEQLQEIVQQIPDLEDVILNLADAIGHGFAALEIEWQRVGALQLPRELSWRPQTWFQIPPGEQNELRLRDNSPNGAELWPFGWVLHIHRARSGYLARTGLMRTLAWPYLFKNYAVRDLSELLDIYGVPIRVGRYPRNASEPEKLTLLRALTSLGHNAAGIIPEGMAIEFHEIAKGDRTPFDAMIEWCERTESKAILGSTLTAQTDGGSGAYALGNVHHEVMWDLVLSDVRQVQTTLTRQLLWPIAQLNGLSAGDFARLPRFVFDTQEPEDMKLYAEALPRFVDMGMKIPARWAHEKLTIPEPEGEEPVLTPAAGAPPTPAPATLAGQLAALKAAGQGPDVVDRLVSRLESDAAAAVKGVLDQINAMLDQAQSLEEFRHLLETAYPTIDEAGLTKLLQLALATAELGGRADVQDGD